MAAAKMAGVHQIIQNLPQGYNTFIGDNGQALSGGQRQRIGLARALYGLPALVVLDEPNANLDSDGDMALLQALAELRLANRTVVIVTHKSNVLAATDYIIMLNNGQVQTAGPRDEVLTSLRNQQNPNGRPRVHAVPA